MTDIELGQTCRVIELMDRSYIPQGIVMVRGQRAVIYSRDGQKGYLAIDRGRLHKIVAEYDLGSGKITGRVPFGRKNLK